MEKYLDEWPFALKTFINACESVDVKRQRFLYTDRNTDRWFNDLLQSGLAIATAATSR